MKRVDFEFECQWISIMNEVSYHLVQLFYPQQDTKHPFFLVCLQLKNLDFEELQLRLTALDPMMEREIEELRQRYTAKRQPILDAMDAKKRRQQNFWEAPPSLVSPPSPLNFDSEELRRLVGSPLLFSLTANWPLNEVRCFFLHPFWLLESTLVCLVSTLDAAPPFWILHLFPVPVKFPTNDAQDCGQRECRGSAIIHLKLTNFPFFQNEVSMMSHSSGNPHHHTQSLSSGSSSSSIITVVKDKWVFFSLSM